MTMNNQQHEQKPLERGFGRDQAEVWCEEHKLDWTATYGPAMYAVAVRDSLREGRCMSAATLSKAWRSAIADYCAQTDTDPPWRAEPDLSSVEVCIRTITETPGVVCINFYPTDGYVPIEVQFANGGTRRYGERGEGWTLEMLQEAARDVLGMAATPAD